jgi:hypothetical protein
MEALGAGRSTAAACIGFRYSPTPRRPGLPFLGVLGSPSTEGAPAAIGVCAMMRVVSAARAAAFLHRRFATDDKRGCVCVFRSLFCELGRGALRPVASNGINSVYNS